MSLTSTTDEPLELEYGIYTNSIFVNVVNSGLGCLCTIISFFIFIIHIKKTLDFFKEEKKKGHRTKALRRHKSTYGYNLDTNTNKGFFNVIYVSLCCKIKNLPNTVYHDLSHKFTILTLFVYKK